MQLQTVCSVNYFTIYKHFSTRCLWWSLTGCGDVCKASHLMAESDGAAGEQCPEGSFCARQWWCLSNAVATACWVLYWSCFVILSICTAALHPGTRTSQVSWRGLWNSTFGCCTSALSATSISACVQVVGPDPGYLGTWLVPSHPGKTWVGIRAP